MNHPTSWNDHSEEMELEVESLAMSVFNASARMVEEAPFTPAKDEPHAILIMPKSTVRMGLTLALWDVGMLVTAFDATKSAERVLLEEPVQLVILDCGGAPELASQMVQYLNEKNLSHISLAAIGVSTVEHADWLRQRGVQFAVPGAIDPVMLTRHLAGALQR